MAPSLLQVTKMACVEGGAVAKSEMKVAYMVILMVGTFLLSWLPYAGLSMLVVFKPDVEIHPLVGTVPVYLAKSSTAYNPIIYIYLNKQVNFLQRHNLSSRFHLNVALGRQHHLLVSLRTAALVQTGQTSFLISIILLFFF